jgi:hypothetical protein
MKWKRHIIQSLAIVFLLLLGQKFGVGLFLHNVFHVTEQNESAIPSSSNDNAISYACNCIDDFSSPFDETETINIPTVVHYSVVLFSFYQQSFFSSFYLFNSLRAPPSLVA